MAIIVQEIGRLFSACDHTKSQEECFHGSCVVTKRLRSGKLVLENREGYIIVVEEKDVVL